MNYSENHESFANSASDNIKPHNSQQNNRKTDVNSSNDRQSQNLKGSPRLAQHYNFQSSPLQQQQHQPHQQLQHQPHQQPQHQPHQQQHGEFQSSLNFMSVPFVPNPHYQAAAAMADTKAALRMMENNEVLHSASGLNGSNSSSGSNSISNNVTGKIIADNNQDNNYYQPQSPNVNYDIYNSNIPNQCLYNAFEFMPFMYPVPNTAAASNYWQFVANYGVPNLGLSAGMDPRQNMYMMDKGSENLINVGPVQSKMPTTVHQMNQNSSKISNMSKANNSQMANSISIDNQNHLLQWSGGYENSHPLLFDENSLSNKMKNMQVVDNSHRFSSQHHHQSHHQNHSMPNNHNIAIHNNHGNNHQLSSNQMHHHNYYNNMSPISQPTFNNNNSNTNTNSTNNVANNVTVTANNIANTNYPAFGNKRAQEILNCVSDMNYRQQLSETMQQINPSQFQLQDLKLARFFVIKSYSEDDLHRAIKYSIWCSTKGGNNTLNKAYSELMEHQGRLFLFFSVNGSGFFAGIAEMISPVNFTESCNCWSQDKWEGKFSIKWHYVKDVRNNVLRHIRSKANDNKPVTNSRDAVEVAPFESGMEFLKVFHTTKHDTSVFDDFEHYERRETDPKFNDVD